MSFKPFEIWSCQPAGWDKPHPCVIISHPARADRRTPVEMLLCSSVRANRQAEPGEFILDEADGLDWPTICKCEPIISMPRDEIKQRRGVVAEERRAALLRRVLSAHAWGEVLAG
jgi:mRNA-degrading endonuclease toxin of MazEF toxin-antitoxin module